MAPSFSMLRSSSRRRDRGEDEVVLDALYGDADISAPNDSVSPSYKESHQPSQPSPPIQEAPVKSSITITINLPWRSKSRSNSLPPTADRRRPEPAEISPPLDARASIESRPPSRSRMVSPPTTLSPKLVSQTQGSSRRSPKPQNLVSLPSRQTPSSTPVIDILSPVVEGVDDQACHQPSIASTFKAPSPRPPEDPAFHTSPRLDNEYDSFNAQFEGRNHQSRSIRSRSPGPEYTRRSAPTVLPSRRARSVDPEMNRRRRYSSSSDSSEIDSDCDSLAESGYGSFSGQGKAATIQAAKPNGLYDKLTTDYSLIIRDVEAEYQAARRAKGRGKSRTGSNADSAGSGISAADSGYNSGPQELVPGGEDLWG